MSKRSAGLLLFRRGPDGLEVLLGHLGGPFYRDRDAGAWGIFKGEMDGESDPLVVARREFEEETGHPAPLGGEIELGEVRKKSGKIVTAWAVEGDLDPETCRSNTFPMEWPPRSGTMIEVPEIDRVAWLSPAAARAKLMDSEQPYLDRLLERLGEPDPAA